MNSRKSRILSSAAVGSATLLIGLGVQDLVGLIDETLFARSPAIEHSEAVFLEPNKSAEPVIPKAVVVSSAESGESEENTESFFDTSGSYYTDAVKLSAQFENLGYLELETRDWNNDRDEFPNGVAIAPSGSLYAGTNFKFKRIAISNREIAFTTETVGGVSYRFTGTFPNAEFCQTSGEESLPDLKGTLIKIKDGRWNAETEIEFYASCGC